MPTNQIFFYTVNKNIKTTGKKNDPLYRSITVSESDLDSFSRVTEERPGICALCAKGNMRHHERCEESVITGKNK